MLAIRQPCDSAVAVRPAFVRCRCTIFPRQRASITAHAAPLGVAHPPTSDVLNWLVEQQDVQPSALQVDRVLMGERGWGLVATAPIAADAVILSVPLPAAITSEGAQDSAWSIHMAGQLLEQLKLGQAAVKRPWLDALPEHVPLPWLYWTSDQLEELQDADTIEEALRMHAVYEDACEMFGGAFNEAQIAWALSLVHSRSFFERGTRVWVPGIDMCNHSLTPNAQVRTVHSPATCQGASASEEVAPPQPPEPSRFELVAGGAGLRAGDEVTISYGSWPSDVFLLFFGWVDPAGNPNDAAVLFVDLLDLATFHQRCAAAQPSNTAQEAAQTAAAVAALMGVSSSMYARMVVTANGLDERLVQAAEAILRAKGGGLTPSQFLRRRCQEVLASMPTSLEADVALVASEGAAMSAPLRMAVDYRISKKRILRQVLDQLDA